VVPGFGGSWNTEALVYNRSVTDDSWVMTPFVKNYDGLINTLIEQGYERDKDLFVWNYDWRKPVADNVIKFNSFVGSKLTDTQKVDVVGHSMGGLIARIWAQDNIDSGKVGKVVTLGSPHSGLVKAYEWWNGGRISGDNDVGSIALAILYQLNRRNLQSEVEVLRNYAPSLKDVLPTFDFVKKGSKLISGNDLYFKNDYLKGKNSSVNLIFDNLLTVAGIGQKTTSNLVLGERNVFDKVLNKWPDGSPLKYVYADGDGAVLKNSAVFSGDVYGEKMSDHGQITDKAINTVLSELGIGVSSTQPIYEMSKKAVFFIGSPAYLNVKCGTDSPIVSDSLGFVLTENLGDCSVNVVGTGSGVYHLVTGTTYDDNWRYFEDSINVGETRVFLINNGKLKSDVVNLDSLYRLVKYDLVKLQSQYPGNTNLTTSMMAANAKQVNSLMTGVFSFRKEKKESLISGAIMKNIETILAIESRNLSPTVVKAAYVKAVQSKSLVDRMTRLYSTKKVQPSVFGAESYKLLEKMVDQSGSDYAKSVLAVKIASEVWR
jgi:pimeloyl-ACP methyl ester carboxylesterase